MPSTWATLTVDHVFCEVERMHLFTRCLLFIATRDWVASIARYYRGLNRLASGGCERHFCFVCLPWFLCGVLVCLFCSCRLPTCFLEQKTLKCCYPLAFPQFSRSPLVLESWMQLTRPLHLTINRHSLSIRSVMILQFSSILKYCTGYLVSVDCLFATGPLGTDLDSCSFKDF